MTRCDDFQVEIEMRLHGGELSPSAARLLDEHLAECASCRAFERLATETEKTMTIDNAAQLETVNLADLRDQISRTLKTEYWRGAGRGLVMLLVMTPFYVALTGTAWPIIVVWLGVAALVLVRSRIRIWRVMRNENERGELLYTYRRDVERRYNIARFGGLIPLVFIALLARREMHAEQPFGTRFYLLAALAAISLAGSAYAYFVRRPALERELTRLKRG